MLIQNSEQKPFTTNFDVKSYYNFKLGDNFIQVYFNISNLFNHLNQTNVYSDSGVADYTTYASDAASQNTGEYINSIDDWLIMKLSKSVGRIRDAHILTLILFLFFSFAYSQQESGQEYRQQFIMETSRQFLVTGV